VRSFLSLSPLSVPIRIGHGVGVDDDERGRIDIDTTYLDLADALAKSRALQADYDLNARVAHDSDSGAGDRLVTYPLSLIQSRDIQWLWPGRLPLGKCVLLVGDPGLGKSILTCEFAAHVSTGRPWPDGSAVEGGDVLMFTAEDGHEDTVKPRVEAAGGDVERVHVLHAVQSQKGDERPFTLDLDAEALARDLAARQMLGRPVRRLTLDPLVAFVGSFDTHVDAAVRRALTPLARIAEEFAVTVLSVMHLNKSAQLGAIYRTGGSIAFVAQARAVLAVTADPNSSDPKSRLLLPLKRNLAPPPPVLRFGISGTPPKPEWDPEPLLDVDIAGVLRGDHGDDADDRPVPKAEEAARFLRDELQDGPQAQEELVRRAGELGIRPRTLERAKARLRIESQREGYGAAGRWIWKLP